MICVYSADCTDFPTNGNDTMAPLTAEVTETLNAISWTGTMTKVAIRPNWQFM